MTIRKVSINVILVALLIFAFIGLYWLTRLGLDAGQSYLWLVVIGFFSLAIVTLIKFAGVDFWFEVPISMNVERAILMLFSGIALTMLIFGFSAVSGLNFYNPFIIAPLASFQIGIGAETFSALSAVTSPFWIFFIIVISAAVIEEIILGFAFVKTGSFVFGFGLRKLMHLDFENNDNWDFAMAMVFSILLFAILHIFNDSYLNPDGSMNMGLFAFAGGFRLLLNILIYKFGNFGLLFSIGVHMVNNAIFLGGAVILAALTTFPGGIILVGFIILLLYFGLTSIPKVIDEGELVAKDFKDFD